MSRRPRSSRLRLTKLLRQSFLGQTASAKPRAEPLGQSPTWRLSWVDRTALLFRSRLSDWASPLSTVIPATQVVQESYTCFLVERFPGRFGPRLQTARVCASDLS